MKSEKKHMVVHSNNLVEAYYDLDLTVTEHKILRFASAKVKNNPNLFPDIEFTVKEFLDAAGIKGEGYYGRFEKIADELSKKRIKIKTRERVGWFPWLQALTYHDGMVNLTFNSLIKDALLNLEGRFTKYDYRYIGDMRSAYSIRLYELLKQYAPIGKRRLHLDVLRSMLGVGDKYKQYGHFKARVLMQAQKELARKGELTFDFEEIKEGRRVAEILFIIKMGRTRKQGVLEDNVETRAFIKEAEYLLDSYGIKIGAKVLSNWEKYGIDMLNTVLEEVKDRNIKHHESYITKVLSSKYEDRKNMKDKIDCDNEELVESLVDFIDKNRTEGAEIIPCWFIKKQLDGHMAHMKEKYPQSLIDELWEKNKDYIEQQVSGLKV